MPPGPGGGGNSSYQSLPGYLGLLGFAVWAILPYLMAVFLARKALTIQANNLFVIIGTVLISLGGVALYVEALLLHRDAQSALAFVAVPFYQWIALGFLAGLHFLLRKRHSS